MPAGVDGDAASLSFTLSPILYGKSRVFCERDRVAGTRAHHGIVAVEKA